MLTFSELRKANVERCNKHFHELEDWSPSDWSNAMAGEAGETCNLTKKIRRGEDIPLHRLADEIADVVIYADLLAARLGLDLGECVRQKFNIVSGRVKSDILL